MLLKRNPQLVFELARFFDEHIEACPIEFEAASNELPDPASPTSILHVDWAIAAVDGQGFQRVCKSSLAVEVETSFNSQKASSMFHASSPRGVACARATLEAMVRVAHPERRVYRELVTAALTEEQLEELPRQLLARHGLDWDDDWELGPMELNSAYYVRGHRKGLEQGHAQALRKSIEALCELLEIPLGPGERGALQQLDAKALDALHADILEARRWPSSLS